MRMQLRLAGVALGVTMVFHGLGHAVMPLRAFDVGGTGLLTALLTVLFIIAMVGFVAAGLGVLGVRPLSRVITPVALVSGLAGISVQAAVGHPALWPGVVLSVALPMLAVLFEVIVVSREDACAHRAVWKRAADVSALVFLGWIAASAMSWPWHRGWGTTADDWTVTLPGDHLPRQPQFEILHSVTIDASRATVWSWLVQLGQDRAGFYSYDWLERLAGADVHNVTEIRPEWQMRQAGDRVYAAPEGVWSEVLGTRPGWTVTVADPGHALVLENWGAFVLVPMADGRTRLLIRSTISNERIPVWAAAVNLTAFELPHFIMQRKMMLTIKALSEGTTGARG
jgi:hypothetical protein